MSVMATSGAPEQARISANKTTMRLNSKFEHNAGTSSGASYGALGSLAGLPDGASSSFEQVQPQVLTNQQIAYGAMPGQQPPHREAASGQHTGDSQRFYSVGSAGQPHNLSSTKQGAKMKNKMNNYLLKQ